MTSDWFTKKDSKKLNDRDIVLCRYMERDLRKSWTEYVVCVYLKEADIFMPLNLSKFTLDIDMSLHYDFAWTYLDEAGTGRKAKTRPATILNADLKELI